MAPSLHGLKMTECEACQRWSWSSLKKKMGSGYSAFTHTTTPPPPPCSSTNAAPTPTPTMAERAHPCNNNRGQPRTAKDSPEKTPGALRTLGDEPTDSLQGRGGRPRTPPSPQLRGRVRRGTSPGPEPLD